MLFKKMNLSLILIFFSFLQILKGQAVISPYGFKESIDNSPGLVGTGSSAKYGFYPFPGFEELQTFYDSSQAFNALEKVSFTSLINTEGNNPTSLIEVASFVDPNSWFKVDLSVQLTDSEQNDTTNTTQNIAIQKLISEGGNISLGIGRPVYYNEFWKGNYFVANFNANFFADLPFVNRRVYNPGIGSQISLTSDFRLYTNISKDPKLSGKLFRLGVELNGVWNTFNSPYRDDNNIPNLPSSISFITIEPYVGLLFFNLKLTNIISGNDLFENKKSIIEVNIVPIKF